MHRSGKKPTQIYLDLKGEPYQEGHEESSDSPCTGNSKKCKNRQQDLFCKKDYLQM